MKTAEVWSEEWDSAPDGMPADGDVDGPDIGSLESIGLLHERIDAIRAAHLEFIRAIQVDARASALNDAAAEIRAQAKNWHSGPMDGYFDMGPKPEELALCVLELKTRPVVFVVEPPQVSKEPTSARSYAATLTIPAHLLKP